MLSNGLILRSSILGAAAIAAAALTVLPAQSARRSFDGAWSVLIVTDQGTCDRAYRYGVQIQNGQVVYDGTGVDIAGTVTPRGEVTVRVRQGSQEATGSGRLLDDSGSGRWSGSSPDRNCSGHWTAERRAS